MKLIRMVVLAAALGVVTGAGTFPALARVDQGSCTICVSNIFSPWDNAGLLTIYMQDVGTDGLGANVTSITAHIMSGSNDVLDVSDFKVTAGTAQSGTWEVMTPIQEGSNPGQLQLGSYSVTLDVADNKGNTATISGVGGLDFTIHPTITLTASRPVFTFLHQTAQLSGTVTGLWPDGTKKLLPNMSVYVADEFGAAPPNPPILVGTTNSSGQYSGIFAPDFLAQTDWPDLYFTYVISTATLTGTNSRQSLPLTTKVDPVTVSAKISPDRIKYGAKATISGNVVFHEGSANGPVAGDTVSMIDEFGDHTTTATTNGNGHFSVRLPNTASTTWHLQAQGHSGAAALWFGTGLAHKSITVALPVTFRSFHARLTPLGYVAIHACLSTNVADMPSLAGPDPKLTIQYSRGAHGPWSKLGPPASTLGYLSSCSGQQMSFEAFQLPGRLINAYYRAVIFPTPAYEAVVSPVVHSWLYATRITNTSVSPTSVSNGGHATITGRLWRQAGRGWAVYGHRRVAIIYRVAGRKTWYLLGRCTSTGKGWFHLRFTDNGVNADLRGLYLGDQTHLWSEGSIVRITGAAAASTQRRHRSSAFGLTVLGWMQVAARFGVVLHH
jgi:hypothetical protein